MTKTILSCLAISLCGTLGAQTFLERLAAKDEALKAGTIKVLTYRTILETGSPTMQTTEASRRVYRPGDRFALYITLGKDGTVAPPEAMAWEGKSCVSVQENQKQSVVSHQKAYFCEPNYELIGLANGPCLPLGHGLSKLTNVQVRGTKPTVITGTASDGTLITATFRSQDDQIPVSIKRSVANSDLSVDWSYSGTIRDDRGVVIPKVAKCVQHGGELKVQAEFRFERLSTEVPSDDQLGVKWLRPGFRVIDTRFQPAVDFGHDELVNLNGGSDVLSLDKLAEFSAKKVAKVETERKRGEWMKARKLEGDRSAVSSWITIVGLAAAAGALFVLLRVLQRSSRKA